nr:zinc finger, CCHC-type [Tanacetum cinerariifolium]GEW35142.1 zinc finger, CCHC-type [Tanacetum cinerariifolium]
MAGGSTVKEMTTNFRKLDKFEGHDFRRWQKKMHFLLPTLKNVESAKELWDSLESKYMAEDAYSKKFLDFKHSLKHGKDDLYLVQLGSYLRIEESLRAQDSDNGKGKEVTGPSVNMIEEGGNHKNNKQNKGKKCGFKDKNGGSGSNKKPKLECWKCGKTGHFKRDCRSGNKKNNASASGSGKGSKDQSQDQDRCWFKTYEYVKDGSVLCMGDDHFAPIHGKRSVVLEFSSGKLVTLFNVLYVPKLYEALHKFRIYKTEVELQQNDLIKTLRTDRGGDYYDPLFFQYVGIIHETTAPYTPQQNGVAKRKNRAFKEMVNFMLSYSGLSDGFWGEAMLTVCYLLNRVPNKRNKTTPYELWYKKRPNLISLRVWGCRVVVRLPDPIRKTLGENGIECIFIGYAEHSKAYKFYVIEPNESVSINTII